MCGIWWEVHPSTSFEPQLDEATRTLISRRGPDRLNGTGEVLCNGRCFVASSVLHIRGRNPTPQPITSENSSVLAFNGEIFGGLQYKFKWFANNLSCTAKNSVRSFLKKPRISGVLERARVYLKALLNTAPVKADDSDSRALSLALSECQQPDDVIRCLSELQGPWSLVYFHAPSGKLFIGRDLFGRRSLLWARSQGALFVSSVAHELLDWQLVQSGCIFVISLTADSIWSSVEIFGIRENIDNQLLNEFDQVRYCSIEASNWRRILHVNSDVENRPASDGDSDSAVVESFIEHLSAAVAVRVLCVPPSDDRRQCSVAVLFSGGVDSLLLTVLAHRHIPPESPIDLINVAFARDDVIEAAATVPDRVTGLTAYEALKKLFPQRRWQFITVDVPMSELQLERRTRISRLVRPSNTVLDDSIGCVIWFAARAKGVLHETKEQYSSAAKVLLLGSGADELLAGYGRHRTRFDHDGPAGLVAELQMELNRIGQRNLGRDDRIVADHGRESRFPFLDESFVAYVNGLRIYSKVRMDLPRGLGEKWLIRQALRTFEMPESLCSLPKRAMQFGTRIAKLEQRKEKGGDRCDRLFAD